MMSYKGGMDYEGFLIGPNKKLEGSRGENAALSFSQLLCHFRSAKDTILPVARGRHFNGLILTSMRPERNG